MKRLFLVLTSVSLLTIIMLTGCGKSEENKPAETGRQIDSTFIHESTVEVASLDKNKDGVVYQCPMHANVISDDSVECAICMMALEEIPVAEAQANLSNNSQMH